MTHLTPCVFCGGEPALWTEEDSNHMITDAWVECDLCHAKGPQANTEIEAAAKWNVAELVKIGIESERARCAEIAEEWQNASFARLHAGEMTAQEMRTVKAVCSAIARAIRHPVGGSPK